MVFFAHGVQVLLMCSDSCFLFFAEPEKYCISAASSDECGPSRQGWQRVEQLHQ